MTNPSIKNIQDTEIRFDDLDLDSRLVRAIKGLKWTNPTLIQAKAIPLALSGKDILARSRTGSGKTAAYVLPILHKILSHKSSPSFNSKTRALILVPSKELAKQVTKNIEVFFKYTENLIKVVNISTHLKPESQRPLLSENPDILVSTPNRISQHLEAGNVNLKDQLEFLIIDEADLILSFGYEKDMEKILIHLPKIYQTLLMSATLTKEIDQLKQTFMKNPVTLKLEEKDDPAKNLSQYSILCSSTEKFLLLFVILKLGLIKGKSLIFVNNIDRCYFLKLFLGKFGIKSVVLNSELPLNTRHHIVESFNQGICDNLIATDENELKREIDSSDDESHDSSDADDTKDPSVQKKSKQKSHQDQEYSIIRGIDFKNVPYVINFDLPKTAKAYIHRIGRTARGNQKGVSLSFVLDENRMTKYDHKFAFEPKIYKKIVDKQKELGREIQPFNFDMKQVEGFRYRVEDTLRSITRQLIKESRVKEIKREILNSEKLKTYFEEKPEELNYIRHDKPLRTDPETSHLKHIPEYLVPKIAAQSKLHVTTSQYRPNLKRKRHSKKFVKKSNPLKSFETDTRLKSKK